MTNTPVFFECAELAPGVAEKAFAVIRIDTGKRSGDGCEGTVISFHDDEVSARREAAILQQQRPS